MPMTTHDIALVNALTAAIQQYCGTMTAFTSATALTANTTLQRQVSAAWANWQAACTQQGQ